MKGCFQPWASPNRMNFIGIWAMDVTKPYKFMGFGAESVTEPSKFIRFGTRYIQHFLFIRPVSNIFRDPYYLLGPGLGWFRL